MMKRGPMPLVQYDGQVYSLRSRSTAVPDFTKMDRFDALKWVCKNTRPRGTSKGNKLAGLCAVLKVQS